MTTLILESVLPPGGSQKLKDKYKECEDSGSFRLNLSAIGLPVIPELVLEYKKLRVLNLSRNRIDNIDDDVFQQLRFLEIVNFSHNDLRTVPASLMTLTRLQKLFLGHNRIVELPDNIGNLLVLEEINVDHNALTSLPRGMGTLERLATLYVANNHLQEVPANFADLPKIASVNLDGNPLERCPEKLLRLHMKNKLLKSNDKRKELISRALKVKSSVQVALAIAERARELNNPSQHPQSSGNLFPMSSKVAMT